jgi:acyl-CoA synthetase (AMP-forming)/AMP-acid ligase II
MCPTGGWGEQAPQFWAVVDTFPLTGSGKIQKFRLRDEFNGLLGPVQR